MELIQNKLCEEKKKKWPIIYQMTRANKDQLGRHQLTTPSSKVNKIPCSYSAIYTYKYKSFRHVYLMADFSGLTDDLKIIT